MQPTSTRTREEVSEHRKTVLWPPWLASLLIALLAAYFINLLSVNSCIFHPTKCPIPLALRQSTEHTR